MTLNIDIPDTVAPQIIDNICAATNYDAASGKTQAVWAKEQLIRTLKQMAVNGAMKTAISSTKASLDAAVIS